MRRVRRPQYIGPTLHDTGIAGQKRLEYRAAYENHQLIPSKFQSYWTRPDVKGALYAMQARICAYCGIETSGLDVEHFRPKEKIEGEDDAPGYWWLAYEYENYFLSCTVCNQRRKRAQFPLEADAPRITYATRDNLTTERRILLDPGNDPVENHFSLDWGDITCRLIPKPGLGQADRQRIETVIEFFGLNLDPELRKQRSEVYEKAVRAANEGRWDDLRRMAMRHYRHSFVARFVLDQVDPSQALTIEQEFHDLIRQLWKDLRTQTHEICELRRRDKRPSPQDANQLESLCWAVIVLHSDPPAPEILNIADLLAGLLEQETPDVRNELLKTFRRCLRRIPNP